jgi:hypothetical protein
VLVVRDLDGCVDAGYGAEFDFVSVIGGGAHLYFLSWRKSLGQAFYVELSLSRLARAMRRYLPTKIPRGTTPMPIRLLR